MFGARAGRAAAEYATTARRAASSVQAQARTETLRLERALSRHVDGDDRIADIRMDMQATLETAAGIDHIHTFNTELTGLLELSGMLDIAQTIVESALRREESRGAHQRTDFPKRNDERFLAHTVIHRESDRAVRVDYLPVTITRWPPGEATGGSDGTANRHGGLQVSA